VLRTIGHHDDQLSGIDLNGMFSSIQWAGLEHSGTYIVTAGIHTSDDAIVRHTFPVRGDSSLAINVGAVLDPDDAHDPLLRHDPVDDPVGPRRATWYPSSSR
jgi:hypothetical protein